MKTTIVFLLTLWASFLVAQKELNIKSVSIFKNQTAFFVKEGKVKSQNKSWSLYGDTIPAALNGTFWISSPSGDFEMVKAYKKKLEKTQKAAVSDFVSMLALNNGKNATLFFADTNYTGTILLLQPPQDDKATVPQLQSPLLALQTANGHTLVFTKNQINNLVRLDFKDKPSFIYDYQVKSEVPALQIDFKSTTELQPINMMYLSQGLAWKPDYLIELTEEDKAKLTLRATVINNAEDIETNKLNLVAGVPNFKYATQVSDLINFLQIPQPANNYNLATFGNFTNTIKNEATYGWNAPTTTDAGATVTTNLSNFSDATAMEDLYFYTLKNILLKKGERAFFDIFNIEIPVEHVYESVLSDNNINYSLDYSFLQKENPVIHTIKLQNNSDFTWTAAAALVTKNDKKQYAPISQDKLNYTSQGNYVSVKLTEAPDVNIKFKEVEIGREVNKKTSKVNTYTYYNDLVKVETEVTIHNYKKQEIRLDLKRMLTGELLKTDTEWKTSPRVQFGYTLNKKTDVCWEMKLKPGEEKTIKFTYEYYTSEHR